MKDTLEKVEFAANVHVLCFTNDNLYPAARIGSVILELVSGGVASSQFDEQVDVAPCDWLNPSKYDRALAQYGFQFFKCLSTNIGATP